MISGFNNKVVEYKLATSEEPRFDLWAKNLVWQTILGNWLPIQEHPTKLDQFIVPQEAFVPKSVVDLESLKTREDYYQFLVVNNAYGGIAVIGEPK